VYHIESEVAFVYYIDIKVVWYNIHVVRLPLCITLRVRLICLS